MKMITRINRLLILTWFLLTGVITTVVAQEVFIPDAGLNAAVREALQKPNGPLTASDLLSLTNLDASARNIISLEGLEAAGNLATLDLKSNHLASVTFPGGLTNLYFLDLSLNQLTNLTLPADQRGLTALELSENRFTSFTLPASLTNLMFLDLSENQLSQLTLPANLARMEFMILSANALTNLNLPSGLTELTALHLELNGLTSLVLPPDLTNLASLQLFFNQLTNLIVPPELTRLGSLDLDGNKLTSFNWPSNLSQLAFLNLHGNQLTNVTLPAGVTNLNYLDLRANQLAKLTLPAGLSKLAFLNLADNKLTQFKLPAGLSSLVFIGLSGNQLTNVALPTDLNLLNQIDLANNQLKDLVLPAGMTNLVALVLTGNQLSALTLPPDLTRLATLFLDGNPLTKFILSEPLAATNLATVVATLQNQGIPVYAYPLTVQLLRPRPLVGAFQFGISGPPGVYAVLGSPDLTVWSELGVVTNLVGDVSFVDATGQFSLRKFYRVRSQNPPPNMVFVPPITFKMGSPTNEPGREIFEGPQATVTLTRGFWIGKYEVTEAEYLEIMNENPSNFPDDLNRAVSSVSWFDATNYCGKLTQRELAAGHIPAGSQYRLPTEAEWECAARAGTETRFSYGADPDSASLTNYAWFLDLGHLDLTVHPVGQKLPNPWGMYDVHGNVWEWCLDWYGDQTGGFQIDPTGPASNPNGNKVMRGGAYDYPDSSCRSATRFFRHPLIPDSDLGFRVVLVRGSL